MKELEEARDSNEYSEMDTLANERDNTVELKWLTDSLKEKLFSSTTKASKGIEIEKHNTWIQKLIQIFREDMNEPEGTRKYNVDNNKIKELFTYKRTKRGQNFIGLQPDFYQIVKGGEYNDLPSL